MRQERRQRIARQHPRGRVVLVEPSISTTRRSPRGPSSCSDTRDSALASRAAGCGDRGGPPADPDDEFLQRFIVDGTCTRIHEPVNGYNAEDPGMQIVAPLINAALGG